MAKETERKFLVCGEFRNLAERKIEILQRYLSADEYKVIRIRIADETAYLTIKSRKTSDSIVRDEWEFQIPFKDAMEMMQICLPGKIEKTRYIIPDDNHKWEVDVFHDRNEGLVVAEIELESEEEQFHKPEWIGEEVTGKPEYYNSNLQK